ncbi:MAG: hypothetical protein A3J55_03535 [Candidatus Ryanbacteria bacterium RIFCSPHIGHO2_02_FULL_45_17b]|uniref:Uncharacterized protein n=1 Tax=Candidatus Ryanbacteria bacterium RIFCSPHIGHO2_01_FULL_45_22 TaxID=1802114 RepID=A0A1G2G2Y6_9BACT|nr:MAG: hypothetical protein A2719_04735 [Candidatus Ryanbacteria bacterium RIFCSPHIGHO2_01_FULL_45_22]OGZ47532.1 MAG: hypothetical protein A3J55_03535 [Candidatus Ryanbacteria bacterium RIFCSPHIGHO2_02_FULL_45_17b]
MEMRQKVLAGANQAHAGRKPRKNRSEKTTSSTIEHTANANQISSLIGIKQLLSTIIYSAGMIHPIQKYVNKYSLILYIILYVSL